MCDEQELKLHVPSWKNSKKISALHQRKKHTPEDEGEEEEEQEEEEEEQEKEEEEEEEQEMFLGNCFIKAFCLAEQKR